MSVRKETIGIIVTGLALLFAYNLIYKDFFPNKFGLLGHDYSLVLSWLLDGYYWSHQNGFLSIPWFTPSFCAGIPAFLAIQNSYFSLPQVLTLGFDPLTASWLTMLFFSGTGFFGFYLLMRGPFRVDPLSALLGAVVFQFNGFFAHRMLIGHLVFHSFMLLPLVSYLLLRNSHAAVRQRQWWISQGMVIAAIALLLAYAFYSGIVTILLPCMMILLAFNLIHGLLYGSYRTSMVRLLIAGTLFSLISLSKLTGALAFISHIPRDLYPIPGFKSVGLAAEVLFDALFIYAPVKLLQSSITNSRWLLEQHTIEFGVTIVPLLCMFIWLFSRDRVSRLLLAINRVNNWQQIAVILLLLTLFLIPFAINIYHPGWHIFLKSVPVINNSSNLLRWFCFYIPLLALLGTLSLDRAQMIEIYRHWIVLIGIAIVILQNIGLDRDFYARQPYDAKPLIRQYKMIKAQDNWQPRIQYLAAYVDSQGRMTLPLNRNDVFIKGYSPISCYEPGFGYQLELLKFETLVPGSIFISREADQYNMKNPACYLYPVENDCTPDGQFKLEQRESLIKFASYQPWQFKMPWYQRVANWISLSTLCLCLLMVSAGSWIFWSHTTKQTKC